MARAQCRDFVGYGVVWFKYDINCYLYLCTQVDLVVHGNTPVKVDVVSVVKF